MPAGYTGITTHIKRGILRNVPFARKNVGVRRDARRGLWVGRVTDVLFTRHVNGSVRHNPGSPKHRRLGHILAALRRGGIRPVKAQVAALVESLLLKTNIDAVGVRGADGAEEIVAIELKTTQHERASHTAVLYDKPCSRQPVLSNGLANTERTHHSLQAGFGALCLKTLLGRQARVSAVVVVSYDTHADLHVVPSMYASSAWFSGAQANPLRGNPRAKQNKTNARRGPATHSSIVDDLCLPWPHTDPRAVRLAVSREYRVVAAQSAAGAPGCHAVGLVLPAGVRALAVCVNQPISALRARQKKAIRCVLLKTEAYIFGIGSDPHTKPVPHVLSPGRHRDWVLTAL